MFTCLRCKVGHFIMELFGVWLTFGAASSGNPRELQFGSMLALVLSPEGSWLHIWYSYHGVCVRVFISVSTSCMTSPSPFPQLTSAVFTLTVIWWYNTHTHTYRQSPVCSVLFVCHTLTPSPPWTFCHTLAANVFEAELIDTSMFPMDLMDIWNFLNYLVDKSERQRKTWRTSGGGE